MHCAATEWHAQHTVDLGIGGHYIQVYAMDSAALHARALFKFLTQPSTRNHLGLNLFNLTPITSARYPGDWRTPLHTHLMHTQDRSAMQQLTSFDGTTMKDLNRMPIDFAREIVQLWRVFVQDLHSQRNQLAASAQTVLDDAIAEAALVVSNEVNHGHGIRPIAW